MKILLSGISQNYGGIESFAINYYKEIKKHDPSFVVDIIGYTDEPAYKDAFLQMGGRVYQMPSRRKRELYQARRRDCHSTGHHVGSGFPAVVECDISVCVFNDPDGSADRHAQ